MMSMLSNMVLVSPSLFVDTSLSLSLGSNIFIGLVDFLTHCLICIPLCVAPAPILAPPCVIVVILGPSSYFSIDIFCMF
jgi:hypothetical protein